MYLKRTPNFQRQHYLYWCNVYNLSYGIREACRGTTIRVGCKSNKKLLSLDKNINKKMLASFYKSQQDYMTTSFFKTQSFFILS